MAKDLEIPPMTLNDIREGLEGIRAVERLIAKGKSGGMDLSDREQAIREKKQKLLKLKGAFYPNDMM